MKFDFKFKPVVTALMLGAICCFNTVADVYALTTYHSTVEKQTVTKGVEYTYDSRITSSGLLNVHVLTVDLTDDTLSFRGVESSKAPGLRETTREMLSDSGAIAGINSDFFHMTSSYTISFGPLVNDGELISASANMNKSADEFSAFFMDKDNNMFFEYFSMNANFSNGKSYIRIGHLNKVDSLVDPVYIDRAYGTDTSVIDNNVNDNVVKIVVEDDFVTKISSAGETVNIPENGYLIIIHGDNYSKMSDYFAVGDAVTFEIQPSIDLDEIEMAFGGGSLLLDAGNTATATSKFPTGNNPRSAFGVNADRSRAIFMVVEGRGNSVGTAHSGMVTLMKEYGAYDAMHLDGGGSSTMVANMPEDTSLQVMNTLSEGTERKVISSTGIFQDRPETQAISEVVVVPDTNQGLLNKSISFNIYALDEFQNAVTIPTDDLYIEAIGMEGNWSGLKFTPSSTGRFQVAVFYTHSDGTRYGGVSDFIGVSQLSKLSPSSDISLAKAGDTATVSMQAIDTEGFAHWVSPYTTYEVLNRTVGTMDGTTFTALSDGATQIKCTKDGQTAYINVKVGDVEYLDKPSSTAKADPFRQSISYASDGAYYINIIGDALTNGDNSNSNYTTYRNKAKTTANTGADLGIYGGGGSFSTSPTIPVIEWTGNYKFLNRGNVSIATISSAKGNISSTDASQYSSLEKDIAEANNNNIIVVTDRTPASFSSSGEADYFRNIMTNYVKDGKNVFVIVNSGDSQWTVVQDGVRYINLPNMWNSDGTFNSNYSMVKLKIYTGAMFYDIVRVN